YMFTTALHSGLLGILMAFAARSWYPVYANTTQSWGISPLEDQQLGGMIMWIPAGVVYIIAGLALLAGWLRESEARLLRHEAAVMRSLGTTPVKTVACIALICLVAGCERQPDPSARAALGDVQHGREKIAYYGCASCHTIPGIHGADALV